MELKGEKMTYEDFIKSKEFKIINKSVEIKRENLNENLFEYQKDLVYLALKKGKFALFSMTGTGKTAMQCEWANQVHKYTNKPVLVLAPLSVASQTVNEAKAILNLDIKLCESQEDVIERALQLWTNEGDVVLTPFGGIGSEGYQALKMGRKAILCELKKEYFEQIPKNMEMALQERQNSKGLFD